MMSKHASELSNNRSGLSTVVKHARVEDNNWLVYECGMVGRWLEVLTDVGVGMQFADDQSSACCGCGCEIEMAPFCGPTTARPLLSDFDIRWGMRER